MVKAEEEKIFVQDVCVGATFYIHRRNRHEGFNSEKVNNLRVTERGGELTTNTFVVLPEKIIKTKVKHMELTPYSLWSPTLLYIETFNNNNNIGDLYCAVPILVYSTAHYIITDILLPRL